MADKNIDNDIQAIVLAAGKSNRFNSDKTRIQINSLPMAIYICRVINNITPNVLIAINENNSTLIKTADKYNIRHLIIPDGENTGLGKTISHVVKCCPKQDGWLFCLGDMPLIKQQTYKTILDKANNATNNAIILPVFNSKPGHPVYFGKRYYTELSKLTGDTGAKSIIRNHSTAVREIITTDKFIHQDIDIAQDLKKLNRLLKSLT